MEVKEVIIGKKGDQPFAITDSRVSRRHAKATQLADGSIMIEDLGSANGTFINGQQIKKKTVDADTIVMLGSDYQLRIGDVFATAKAQVATSGKGAAESIDISHLRAIYDKYEADKIKLQQDTARKQFLRSLPGVIPTVLLVMTMLFGDSMSAIKPFIGLVMLLGIPLSLWLAYKSQQQQPQKLAELNKQFMIDYVCPKCKSFLGFTPYETLLNRGYCANCKTKWHG